MGTIEAFSAAVTVRNSKPYRPLSSVEVHTARPTSPASAATACSLLVSSGEKASATAIAPTPASRMPTSVERMASTGRPSVTSKNA